MNLSPEKKKQNLEIQLNRLIVLLRNGLNPQEERQACIVLQSLFEFSENEKLTVSLNISEKLCEICQGLISESKCHTTAFTCGHKICSKDCLVQYLSNERICELMPCPRKTCEIKTIKDLILLNIDENINDLNEFAVMCKMCEKLGPIAQSLKLPCSDRFCHLCILSYVNSADFIEFGQNCPFCFKKIPKKIVKNIKSPEFEDKIRDSYLI